MLNVTEINSVCVSLGFSSLSGGSLVKRSVAGVVLGCPSRSTSPPPQKKKKKHGVNIAIWCVSSVRHGVIPPPPPFEEITTTPLGEHRHDSISEAQKEQGLGRVETSEGSGHATLRGSSQASTTIAPFTISLRVTE